MTALPLIRTIFGFINKIDRADFAIFRIIPKNLKRKLVRKFYKPLTQRLPEIVELQGLKLNVPRSLDYSYILQDHEPETQALLRKKLKSGMIAVDVGANIGFMTMLMARLVGPKGKVYAIEPGPENLELLKKNIALNGCKNIEILPYAAGASRKSQTFYLREAGTLNSLHVGDPHATNSIQVEVAPLDEIITDRVDFIKLDVEGAEIEALRGMQHILALNPNIQLIVECNPATLAKASATASDLITLLQDAGFSLSVVDGQDNSQKTVQEILAKKPGEARSAMKHFNLFAQRSVLAMHISR